MSPGNHEQVVHDYLDLGHHQGKDAKYRSRFFQSGYVSQDLSRLAIIYTINFYQQNDNTVFSTVFKHYSVPRNRRDDASSAKLTQEAAIRSF